MLFQFFFAFHVFTEKNWRYIVGGPSAYLDGNRLVALAAATAAILNWARTTSLQPFSTLTASSEARQYGLGSLACTRFASAERGKSLH